MSMSTNEIIETCKRVVARVDERMDDEGEDVDFSWEDAVEECRLSKEDGLIVLAILHTAMRCNSEDLSDEIAGILC